MAWIRIATPGRGYRALRETLLFALLAAVVFIASAYVDLFRYALRWLARNETLQLDQFSTLVLVFLIAAALSAAWHRRALRAEAQRREKSEEALEHLEAQLQLSTEQLETLTGLLPVCASCNRIRDVKGEWSRFDEFIQAHSGARITQGYCPDCARRIYGLHSHFAAMPGRQVARRMPEG